jgi:hypothetical protein
MKIYLKEIIALNIMSTSKNFKSKKEQIPNILFLDEKSFI